MSVMDRRTDIAAVNATLTYDVQHIKTIEPNKSVK